MNQDARIEENIVFLNFKKRGIYLLLLLKKKNFLSLLTLIAKAIEREKRRIR